MQVALPGTARRAPTLPYLCPFGAGQWQGWGERNANPNGEGQRCCWGSPLRLTANPFRHSARSEARRGIHTSHGFCESAQAGRLRSHVHAFAVVPAGEWIPCHSRVGGNFAGMTKTRARHAVPLRSRTGVAHPWRQFPIGSGAAAAHAGARLDGHFLLGKQKKVPRPKGGTAVTSDEWQVTSAVVGMEYRSPCILDSLSFPRRREFRGNDEEAWIASSLRSARNDFFLDMTFPLVLMPTHPMRLNWKRNDTPKIND